jgi:hypothetical protein
VRFRVQSRVDELSRVVSQAGWVIDAHKFEKKVFECQSEGRLLRLASVKKIRHSIQIPVLVNIANNIFRVRADGLTSSEEMTGKSAIGVSPPSRHVTGPLFDHRNFHPTVL